MTIVQSPADFSTELMQRVGRRVRACREKSGISRRILSEQSGVSPRYLAQLEAGEGNISLRLLSMVADALGHKIEWFLLDANAASQDFLVLWDAFNRAGSEQRTEALEILKNAPQEVSRENRICLIGLRGAGKTTLGKAAAAHFGLPFVELNKEIERKTGMPMSEVMAFYGSDGFRRLEAEALERITRTQSRMILAVAGGAVADPDSYDHILRHFHTIWVKASPSEHMDRVRAQGDERPMADNPAAMQQLETILAARSILYQNATHHLDTSGKALDQSVADICAMIDENGLLL